MNISKKLEFYILNFMIFSKKDAIRQFVGQNLNKISEKIMVLYFICWIL